VPGLTAALRRLLADASLRARLGAAARETVRARFDARRAAQRYRALFGEIASRRGARLPAASR